MTTGPQHDSSPHFSLSEAAMRLDLSEGTIREWLATFSWERHYDGAGHLYLTAKDLDFLRVIKSLKDVDRSCESIVRIITTDIPLELDVEAREPADDTVAVMEEEAPPDGVEAGLEQIETLKAELKELHAKPTKKPFWRFWG